jgi:membrane protein DedA with SNARE-associated domain
MTMVEFLFRHGELVLFVYILADQLGVPVPAAPVLLTAGGLAAAGKLNLPFALGLAIAGSLVADLAWFMAGRLRGHRVLGLLCRVSLEPDSCVRRTETIFLRYGPRALLVSKFIPGFSTIAPPLAGIVGIGIARFAFYSAGGALLWAGVWMGLGHAVGDALERASARINHLGALVGATLGLIVIAYVAFKWLQRRRFLHQLRVDRIQPAELRRRLDAGEAVLVVDVRTSLDLERLPFTIPGAVRLTPEELERRPPTIARRGEIVVYCS